jgi:hypothetical protein
MIKDTDLDRPPRQLDVCFWTPRSRPHTGAGHATIDGASTRTRAVDGPQDQDLTWQPGPRSCSWADRELESHWSVRPESAAAGKERVMLRLSIGLEREQPLFDDLRRALRATA